MKRSISPIEVTDSDGESSIAILEVYRSRSGEVDLTYDIQEQGREPVTISLSPEQAATLSRLLKG